jgi:Holliday junction resolvase-like predicted endonuclease
MMLDRRKTRQCSSVRQSQVHQSQERGNHAEQKVCDHFLKLGYRVLYHRKKIFGVEFDLILAKQDLVVYVEVKSVHSSDFYLKRWPQRQKQRFLRVAAVLSEQQRSQFFLAMVGHDDRVHLFEVSSEV